MKMWFFLLFILSSLNLFSVTIKTIDVGMEESGDWPPYEYFHHTDKKKAIPTGVNVKILNHISKKYNIVINYIKMPWIRCLIALKEGKEIQIVFPTSFNEERRKNFYFSKSVYSITPHYFYLKKNFPNGLKITKPQDLLKHGTVGGKKEYNYTNFGFNNNQIDRGAENFKSLISKLKSNRNKIILARYEIFAAYPLVSGKALLDNDIGFAPIPGVPKEKFYFIISKKYKYGKLFVQIINTELDYLKKTGILEKWLNEFLQEAANIK